MILPGLNAPKSQFASSEHRHRLSHSVMSESSYKADGLAAGKAWCCIDLKQYMQKHVYM